jgi:mannitol/fructose-specific phosphotransferase system IIA component (Ntr-type)
MERLFNFLAEDAIVLDMKATTKEEAIEELIDVAVARGSIDGADKSAVLKAVMEREKRGSTGLGHGIAVPHVRECPQVNGITGAFGRSEHGIPFNAVDGGAVNLVFLILGGEGTGDEHAQLLRKLARLRENEHFLRFLRDARDVAAATEIIREIAGS